MRVALDVTPLLGVPTGIGTFVQGASSGLVDAGQTVVGYGLTRRRCLRSSLPDGVERGRTVPAALALALWRRGVTWIGAEWLAGSVDVIHGTNFVVPPARTAARVVTVHDLTAVRFPQMCAPASRRYPELVRRAALEGAWVHTPSTFVAQEVIELLAVPAGRVRPIAHGVDHVVPLVGGRPGRRRDVLALGTVEPRKDLPMLVRAFDSVAASREDVRLVIAGAAGWGAQQLDQAIAAARHANRIVRLGYVDDTRRAQLMAQAKVFAYPSLYEGFGLPPLEAMAAGVPVVATDAGAVPEVVGDAARLVAVGDEKGFASALSDVLDHPELAASLVARGRERAARFTWAGCATGLVAMYEEAIACK